MAAYTLNLYMKKPPPERGQVINGNVSLAGFGYILPTSRLKVQHASPAAVRLYRPAGTPIVEMINRTQAATNKKVDSIVILLG